MPKKKTTPTDRPPRQPPDLSHEDSQRLAELRQKERAAWANYGEAKEAAKEARDRAETATADLHAFLDECFSTEPNLFNRGVNGQPEADPDSRAAISREMFLADLITGPGAATARRRLEKEGLHTVGELLDTAAQHPGDSLAEKVGFVLGQALGAAHAAAGREIAAVLAGADVLQESPS